nr:cell division protein SepF [Actinomycetota bacterium]
MGFADVWNRTLVYFGIAEEDDEWDENGYVTEEELERGYRDRPNVRRLSPRRRSGEFDDWTDSGEQATQVARPRLRSVDAPSAPVVPAASVKVHLVLPRSFNDAQQVAD